MQDERPDTHPVTGQGDPLDRGSEAATSGKKAPDAQPNVVDDELTRPEKDRSPLT